MIHVDNIPKYAYDGMGDYFKDLPEDKYAEPGYRFRRFSPIELNNYGDIVVQKADHFIQSSELNSEFGGIERKFEPLDPKILELSTFKSMVYRFVDNSGVKKIDCHQVRIEVDPSKPAPAAPEGKHQDGYDFICAHIVTRHNITGGNFMVWTEKDAADEDYLFKDTLVGRFAILDDTKYFHTGDDLNVIDPSRKGIWEWFILGGYL